MAYIKNGPWVDYPDTSTPITADALNAIEQGIYALHNQSLNAQTASYTLVADDSSKLITMSSSSALDLTVPANVFTEGQRVDVIGIGAGLITVVAGSGMTVTGASSLVQRAQWSGMTIFFTSATSAIVVGDMA